MDTSTNTSTTLNEHVLHLYALTQITGIGGFLARQLISYCGSPEGVFKANKASLSRIPGIGAHTLAYLLNQRSKELEEAHKTVPAILEKGYQIIDIYSPLYPQRLKAMDDTPPLLYYKGNLPLNFQRSVAVVGTRKATDYGKNITEQIVKNLQPYNVVIVSGLAYGIDIAAHRAALHNGIPTVGVMANGLDIIYPSVHKATAQQMLQNGGLLTEYPPGTKPDAPKFPARNRIVAALADVVIIVESAARGGGLVTAKMALDYGKEVFAVPGRLSDKYSEGCNLLIDKGEAGMLLSVEQLAEKMNWTVNSAVEDKKPVLPEINFGAFEDDEAAILKILQNGEPVQIDELARKSGTSINKIAGIMLNLEFKGMIKAMPGSKYKLINSN